MLHITNDSLMVPWVFFQIPSKQRPFQNQLSLNSHSEPPMRAYYIAPDPIAGPLPEI